MYLLVIGAPRSGTTLLASMIGSHSDVAMLIEDRFFSIRKLTGKKILANKLCIPIQLELTQKANSFTRTAQKIGLFKNLSVSKFNSEDYLSLKDPKIIAIIRDGNHVVSSIMKRGKKEKQIATARWNRAIQIISELYKKNPDKTLVVSYEDLVKEPESLLRKICAFLQIDFEPQMLEGYKHNILYPGESGIDKSRANQSHKVLDSETSNNQLAIHKLYNELLEIKTKP